MNSPFLGGEGRGNYEIIFPKAIKLKEMKIFEKSRNDLKEF